MATCSFSSLWNEAATNGFLGMDTRPLWVCVAELLYEWSGSTKTASQLYQEACASGFGCADDSRVLKVLTAQLLCDISADSSAGSTNLIPAGANYDDVINYSLNFLAPITEYEIVWGENESEIWLYPDGSPLSILNPGAGQSSVFTTPSTFPPTCGLYPNQPGTNQPVTALIYKL